MYIKRTRALLCIPLLASLLALAVSRARAVRERNPVSKVQLYTYRAHSGPEDTARAPQSQHRAPRCADYD